MNQTAAAVGNAASSSSIDGTGTITAIHFALMALLAVLVVIGIVYGARAKHRRVRAEQRVEDHAVEAEQAGATHEPTVDEGGTPIVSDEPAEVTPPSTPADTTTEDDGPAAGPVTQIKGLGPKVATRLAELGITTVGQIAALDDDRARDLDAQLGPFAGRLERDRWIEQARFLAAGDTKGFEAVFGRL